MKLRTGRAGLAALALLLGTGPLAATPPPDPHETPRHVVLHEGRGSFLLQQLPLSLWYGYGLSQALTTDNTSIRVETAVGLLGASACYFGPLALIWNRPMTNGQAHLAVAAGYRGIFAGLALSDLFGIGNEPVQAPPGYEYETINHRPRMGAMVLTGLAAQTGGYFLARDMSPGRAALVTAWSDFGWTGGMVGAFTHFALADDRYETRVSAWYLGGLAVGATAGHFRQKRWDCTEGQVTFVRTAGFLGMTVPLFATYALTGLPFDRDEHRYHMAWLGPLMIAGNLGAALGAERLIRDARLSPGEGAVTLGCTVAGGLLGAGIGWLVTDEADFSMRPVLGVSALGALGGLALGLRLTPGWSAAFSAERPGPAGRARLHLDTGALAAALADYALRREFAAPHLVRLEF